MPNEYLPSAVVEALPGVDAPAEEEEIPPIDQRLHAIAKKLLAPLKQNSGNLSLEISQIATELKDGSNEYSPEAVEAGLKFCKQMNSTNNRRLKFTADYNEIKGRKEIETKMKSYKSTSADRKEKVLGVKENDWNNVVIGVSPIAKDQLQTFIELIKEK